MNSSGSVAFKRVIRLGFSLPLAIGALIIWGFYSLRVASLPHTVATIEETWTERVKNWQMPRQRCIHLQCAL